MASRDVEHTEAGSALARPWSFDRPVGFALVAAAVAIALAMIPMTIARWGALGLLAGVSLSGST